MTLSEIRNFLNDKDILLTRSLGQTFMHDQNQLRKIVALARLAPGDSVIEIGPGLGPLTELLLEVAGHVTAPFICSSSTPRASCFFKSAR